MWNHPFLPEKRRIHGQIESSLLRLYCENHLVLIHCKNNVLFPRAFCLGYEQRSKMLGEDITVFFSQNPNKQTNKTETR